jgi:hypothetical protein
MNGSFIFQAEIELSLSKPSRTKFTRSLAHLTLLFRLDQVKLESIGSSRHKKTQTEESLWTEMKNEEYNENKTQG